jgi:hypothetical protein
VRDRRIRDPWFAKVWRASGLPGKPPPVFVSKMYAGSAAGWQPNENRRVYITPNILMGLKQSRQGKRQDLAALQVLLHEMAHVAQPVVLRQRVIEGGAEAFAHHNVNRIAEKFYPPFTYEPLDYRSPASKILKPPRVRPQYMGYPKYEKTIKPLDRDYYQFGKRPPSVRRR